MVGQHCRGVPHILVKPSYDKNSSCSELIAQLRTRSASRCFVYDVTRAHSIFCDVIDELDRLRPAS